MAKTLDTLVEDIFTLFDENQHHEPSEENLKLLGQNIIDIMKLRLAKRDEDREALRFSSLGKKDRQLWYMEHAKDKAEPMSSKTFFKFLYGDLLEQLLLFLAREAGHDVTREQEELEVGGVKGHIDAVIDGVVVDVKSASPYSFKKFKDGRLFDDDPFGYIGQISGYAETLTPGQGAAFLVADKVHGDIHLMKIAGETTAAYKPAERIDHLKEVLASDVEPPRCYEDVKDGESGNRKLGLNCSYCPFKQHCWRDANGGEGLRTFLYYDGPRFLTNVARRPAPHIKEITNNEERSED
jgi:hypothetical protein